MSNVIHTDRWNQRREAAYEQEIGSRMAEIDPSTVDSIVIENIHIAAGPGIEGLPSAYPGTLIAPDLFKVGVWYKASPDNHPPTVAQSRTVLPIYEGRAAATNAAGIYADDRRAHCFGCGWSGDVLDFVQQAYGVKLPGAIEMLDGGALRELEQQRAPAKPKADMRPVAQRIVNGSVAIEGTPAEVYLRSRGITMDLPHTLRFARIAPPQIDGNGVLAANGPDLLPALIAIVTDAAGELLGLQRTYLTEDGRKAATKPTDTDRKPKVKYSLGNVIGGSVQLGPAAASMLVTEGLEDGLTLAQALGRSVWVAAGTSMLPAMSFPASVRAIVIGADGDAPGEVAAQKAAEAFTAAGRAVRIMRPTPPFKDFNAELMEKQP